MRSIFHSICHSFSGLDFVVVFLTGRFMITVNNLCFGLIWAVSVAARGECRYVIHNTKCVFELC